MEPINRFFVLMICGDRILGEEKSFVKKVYSEMGRDEIYKHVSKKKILPFAAKTLSALGCDSDYWNDIFQQFADRNNALLAFLDEAYAALEANGVKKMFVSENFGALLSSNSDIGLFSSGDVDNYADYSEKEKIYAAMKSIGCEIKERYALKNHIASEFFPSASRGLPEGFYFSVDFYPLARLKLPCFIKADNFIDWDRLHNYGETKIKLAPPEALMYICLMHISLHSFCRAPDTRLYIDIYNMAKLNLDFESIAGWCAADNTRVRAAVSASVSNMLVKTDIPAIISDAGRRSQRLVKSVYDSKQKCLRAEPSKLKIMRIDMMCDDRSDLHGLFDMFFPDKEWMKKTYGRTGFNAHIKHLKRMI
ncbi:MAG: hypothetical protein WCX81_01980 [Monoglobales bacterium]